jgi:hypothetical protein
MTRDFCQIQTQHGHDLLVGHRFANHIERNFCRNETSPTCSQPNLTINRIIFAVLLFTDEPLTCRLDFFAAGL